MVLPVSSMEEILEMDSMHLCGAELLRIFTAESSDVCYYTVTLTFRVSKGPRLAGERINDSPAVTGTYNPTRFSKYIVSQQHGISNREPSNYFKIILLNR